MIIKVLGIIILLAIITTIIWVLIVLIADRIRQKRREREFRRQDLLRKVLDVRRSKDVPNTMIKVNYSNIGYPEYISSGNAEELSDLFAILLRNDKSLRDMIKLSFRKANKALD
jgi:hypothetical protein